MFVHLIFIGLSLSKEENGNLKKVCASLSMNELNLCPTKGMEVSSHLTVLNHF